jgi:FKBP-type peptidyl-prolyl cis-trans isomerase
MKLKTLTALLTVGLLSTSSFAADAPALSTQKDKLSYSFGFKIGNSIKQQDTEVNLEVLYKGIKDALSGEKAQLSDEEIAQVLTAFQQERMHKQQEQRKKQAEESQQEGEKFLEENKKKEGVVTLPSGLQYKVITEGKGKKPKATDTVTTHYRGTLLNGTEFDSSYKRNEPATFPLSGVIPGWTEALQLMSEGSKYELYIPSKLAYGERGAGREIPPNATLKFEVELISVKEEAKPDAKAEPEAKADVKADVKPESKPEAKPAEHK